MMKLLSRRKWSVRAILMICAAIIAILPLLLLAARLYWVFEQAMVNMAKNNVQELISSKNHLIDTTFDSVREASLNLQVDEDLYNTFNSLELDDKVSLIQSSEKVAAILRKYFYNYPQVVSVHLLTKYITFGYGKEGISFDQSFFNTEIYRAAESKKGAGLFVPAYNYNQLIGRQGVGVDSDYLFSFVRSPNITLVTKQSTSIPLDESKSPLILIISFRENAFSDEFSQITLPAGSEYMVMDQEGHITSHSNKGYIGEINNEGWAEEALKHSDGVEDVDIGGESSILCHYTSPVTGWTTMVTIPRSSLRELVIGDVRGEFAFLAILIVVFIIALSFFIRKISRTMQHLLGAIDQIGDGAFGIKAAHTPIKEFNHLVDRFNNMSFRIKRLVDENYITQIRQKENEIAILTTQLNPHFLYNTLNTIHLCNVNGDHAKTGELIISLSRMLNYIVDNREELKPLKEDLVWLRQYVYIMQCRYDGAFEMIWAIGEDMMDVMVPKLFLQPVIENSILHGFRNRESGGIIRLSASMSPDSLVFEITDNGAGIPPGELESWRNAKSGVGLKNTEQRLKLLFGEDTKLFLTSEEGTTTVIIIPRNPPDA